MPLDESILAAVANANFKSMAELDSSLDYGAREEHLLSMVSSGGFIDGHKLLSMT